MGRDWYWRSGAKPSDRHSARTRTRTALPGCITAVFHLFQSHRFHCPFKPRNCLESEEEPSASLASTCNEDDILNIPMGIQIKTKVGGPDNDTPGAGTNTPTLVARLMGLDLLPEPHSRSLPATPRTSSARRSDADRHHRPRLSLQINKENMSATDELIMSRLSSLTKRKELKREYETVKQSVTRKVGMDITNTVRNREELVSHSSTVKNSTNSGSKLPESPRIQKQTNHKLQQNQQQPSAARKCKKGSNKKLVSRLKKPQQASEKTRNKKEEPFVRRPTANRVDIPDKKCRKTPLSNDLLNAKVPTLVLVKRIQQKQVQVPILAKRVSSTATYIKQQPGQAHATSTASAGDEAECEYIARILRRTGLNKETQVSISCFFSPSHPLHPSIFHYLERFDKNNETKCGQLSRRCNRMLLFHLVDEVLSEILKPCFNMKPWANRHGFSCMDGSRLIDMLWSRIRSFPRSDCRVLEDIDALVGRDTPDVELRSVMAAYEEQGEGIVAEIEKDMLEALVFELYEA
ncbi:TON1 Recruiting Motif 25 [Hibiscus trionum]|uniref:TON1 Recruiting Motif 25 n=1 Tax=Hibiscus trionum TaxID=183268 RepID=A0A9W7MCE4_HIBTR|nr:TON1 Recruiting Motif 25 [Hibiscus trionum]